jgi:CheY-like chemotaxis protein
MNELGKENPLRGIALTGYGMEHDVARSENAGFDAHLTKPVRIQSLEAALDATARLIEKS